MMKPTVIRLGHIELLADPSGALHWPERGTVIVADLHFEKGSSYARRGSLLPPYDTRATLERLEDMLARLAPTCVISLGDGFHDEMAAQRLAADDAARLRVLTGAATWIWIAGNHDPSPPGHVGGHSADVIELDGVTLRHEPQEDAPGIEIAGHLHPKASVRVRGRHLSRPCFAHDGRRLVMPAFGSFTGGLDVFEGPIRRLFPTRFQVLMLGSHRLHTLPAERLSVPSWVSPAP